MDAAILLIFQAVLWLPVSAFLTVEADPTLYDAEYGNNVTISCRFQGSSGSPGSQLSVIWHRIEPNRTLEVYRWHNGEEKLETQDEAYQGRVRLLTEDLEKGWAKLQMRQLRISDSGRYQCLVQLGGADYKQVTLKVKAPFWKVTKRMRYTAEDGVVELLCQSQGYPATSVTWWDGAQRDIPANTSTKRTSDLLYQVTSYIHVRSSVRNNYTCNFTDGGPSTSFDIPDEIPVIQKKNYAIAMSLIIVLALAAVVAVLITFRKHKDLWRTRRTSFTCTPKPMLGSEREVADPLSQ